MLDYTIYKISHNDYGYPVAHILSPKDSRPTEMSGWDMPAEFAAEIKKQYGQDAKRVPATKFQEELDRRTIHSPAMIALLRDSYMGDISSYTVYGSPLRPMSATWARIPDAVYINTDKRYTGYHTYVAVPATLEKDVIDRYELMLVSHPQSGNQ